MGVVQHLGDRAEDCLGGQRRRQLSVSQAGEPPQLGERLVDRLGEGSGDLVHADADMHVRDTLALGRGDRTQLGRLADHHVRSPTLDRLQERGQRRLGVDPREHLTQHHIVGFIGRQRRQTGHDRTDHLGWRVGERLVPRVRPGPVLRRTTRALPRSRHDPRLRRHARMAEVVRSGRHWLSWRRARACCEPPDREPVLAGNGFHSTAAVDKRPESRRASRVGG